MIRNKIFSNIGAEFELCNVVTSKEIKDLSSEAIHNKDFKRHKYHLWIFTNVEKYNMSEQNIIEQVTIAYAASKVNPKVKVAIVSQSPLAYGIGRMYEAHYENNDGPWSVMVFRDIENARKWTHY